MWRIQNERGEVGCREIQNEREEVGCGGSRMRGKRWDVEDQE